MANFIIGTEVKFAIDLTAQGFSMDEDDFDITIQTSRGSISASKDEPSEDGKLVIYRVPALGSTSEQNEPISIDSSDDSSDGGSGVGGTWYAIFDTTGETVGKAKVIATAHIIDSNAFDGVRNEVAVATLGNLVNP